LASSADENTAYVAFDGHRSDNRAPWLFKTSDGGRSWTNLSAALAPGEPIYVVLEDDRNTNLLFAGTEFGVQWSMNAGRTWQSMGGRMTNGMPTVAVHDLVIHPRDRDLIAGTHGRGLYVLDDISALEQWTPVVATRAIHVFEQRRATLWEDMSRSGQLGENTWAGENPPSVARPAFGQRDRARIQNTPLITMAFGPGAAGAAILEIAAPDGRVGTFTVPARPGITRFRWDGRLPAADGDGAGGRGRGGRGGGRGAGGRGGGPSVLGPGTFGITVRIGSEMAAGQLQVRVDPTVEGG
jgi:hypothetical protein